MKQHLFILLCFTGVIPFILPVPRYYFLIQQGKTWSDALTYCRAQQTDMAVIETSDDMVQFQDEAQRQKFSSSAWVGLYNDINSWRWSMGNEPLGSMRLWSPNQPDNWQGNETCIAIYYSVWVDKSCTSICNFVCFDGNKTGNQRFIYISKTLTWFAAQSYCRTYYTDLATIRTTTENSFIGGLNYSYMVWIGLFRDAWKWTDNTSFSTISWKTGKPDNALGNENCGYINNSQAVDAQCSDIMPFYCYSYITGKQQILRVKVQFSQDVNNPAVKEAMLEQIKQKLMDHGMPETITVKWREKPDGTVFYMPVI
ncbi:hypothetical protein Q7C36_010832 [Tachysurus vachellii]|uniref:C-type lectin domain-containing protein n=1 Tax=Tachysurus vachellii TaxID=175792 RepID=A0AA88N1J4_TACVA|nr:hypothetical protein Q7C36_010832 [Tachysurus vachellii]